MFVHTGITFSGTIIDLIFQNKNVTTVFQLR